MRENRSNGLQSTISTIKLYAIASKKNDRLASLQLSMMLLQQRTLILAQRTQPPRRDRRRHGVLLSADQTSHRAATIGGEAFYCPLTPSGGLHFDFGTEATPLVSIGYGSGTAARSGLDASAAFPARLGVRARAGAFSPAQIRNPPRTHPGCKRKRKIAGRQQPWRADQIALGRRCGYECFIRRIMWPPVRRAD